MAAPRTASLFVPAFGRRADEPAPSEPQCDDNGVECAYWCSTRNAGSNCLKCDCAGCSFCVRLWDNVRQQEQGADVWFETFEEALDDAKYESTQCESGHADDLVGDEQCQVDCETRVGSETHISAPRRQTERPWARL